MDTQEYENDITEKLALGLERAAFYSKIQIRRTLRCYIIINN